MIDKSKLDNGNPPRFIRRRIFGMTQVVYANLLGVKQGTVSKWESAGGFTSVDGMKAVRALAKRMKIKLNDTLLFEVSRHALAKAKKSTPKTKS